MKVMSLKSDVSFSKLCSLLLLIVTYEIKNDNPLSIHNLIIKNVGDDSNITPKFE